MSLLRPRASSLLSTLALLVAVAAPPAAAATSLPPVSAAEAAVSLTTAEGVGLQLSSYEADAVIAGPLAFTELRLTFHNPEDRVIEGRFRLVLPDGAGVSRFAMKIDGRFMEGEVVEKQAARRAYEDFLHRRQDPALLEQATPNEFTARVFPIPARGDKELIVSFSQELASSSTPYRIALVGLPEIGSFHARVRDGDRIVLDDRKSRFVPTADVVVTPRAARTLRSDDVVVARVTPVPAGPAADAPLHGTLILLDTSASRALGLHDDEKLVQQLVRQLAQASSSLRDAPLHVLAFDQEQASLYAGTFAGCTDAVVSSWKKRRALGASDLSAALREAAVLARASSLDRVILVSDGVVSAGDDGEALLDSARALGRAGVQRMDAIAVGGLRDDDTLSRLVRGTLAQDGAVLSSSLGAPELARRLRLRTFSNLDVTLAGASWVWPRRLDGVQPGDEVLLVAEVPSSQRALSLRIGERTIVVDEPIAGPAVLLRRAWAKAKIDRLLDARARSTDARAQRELDEQIVTVSTKHRVLSPQTALLVLQTEDDYARFGIERTALASILTVTADGLTMLERHDVVVTPPQPQAAPPTPTDKAKKMRAREGESDEGAQGVPAEGEAPGADAAAPSSSAPSSSSSAPMADAAPSVAPSDGDDAAKEEVAAAVDAAPPPPAPMAAAAPRRQQDRGEPSRAPRARRPTSNDDDEDEGQRDAPRTPAYTGTFATVMELLSKGRVSDAVSKARGWREEEPGNLLALIALGEALEKSGDVVEAARAYGSLIDLFSSRADIRRLAGARLDRLAAVRTPVGDDVARLALDTWHRAAVDRPDHPQGPRGEAWALVRLQRYDDAMAAIERALMRPMQPGRFAGVHEILVDDLGLIAAMAKASAPPSSSRAAIDKRLAAVGASMPTRPSLRFVLWWETDANDVDFHIHDGRGAHAFYSQPELASGGHLYADVTTGFGPECFTIEGTPRAYPYRLEAHYYSRGPMGFGMGALRVVQHDGKGHVVVEDRPFIIMADGAFVDLGVVRGPLHDAAR